MMRDIVVRLANKRRISTLNSYNYSLSILKKLNVSMDINLSEMLSNCTQKTQAKFGSNLATTISDLDSLTKQERYWSKPLSLSTTPKILV